MKNKLPEVLKRIMKERRLSQRQLSKASGVSLSTLNGMLAGKESYSVVNLIAIADALSISLDRLLRDEERASQAVDSIPATEILDGVFRLRLEKLNLPKSGK